MAEEKSKEAERRERDVSERKRDAPNESRDFVVPFRSRLGAALVGCIDLVEDRDEGE